jgi:arsenite-transporting ATPase
MRIILFTGKGGVGKTSVAAATALACSDAGLKTLVMSTDPAHSLADSFDLRLGSDPTPIAPRLWGQQIDAQSRLEENWREIQEYAVEVLAWTGMSGIEAEELSIIPGLDELFSLADVRSHYESANYDVLVIDCAPTAETMRLLSLPEIMSWYIERIFPIERRIVKAVRPVLKRVKSLPPIASDNVFGAVERFYRRIDGIREILIDPSVTSIRLVVNAEKMVIAEAQRTLTFLLLFGYRIDAVIANRLIPDDVQDPYFERWKAIQSDHLATIENSFHPVPILKARLFDREMVGSELLRELAREVYAGLEPSSILYSEETMRVAKEDGVHALYLKLPFAERGDVDLTRLGDELFVKLGSTKRNVVLPQMLRRGTVTSATLEDDWLRVVFEIPAGEVQVAQRGSDGRG